MREVYGVSRSRDKKGNVVKQGVNPYVNCIHAQVGGGWMTMGIFVAEVIYEVQDVSVSERSE